MRRTLFLIFVAGVFLGMPQKTWAQHTSSGVITDTLDNFDDAFQQLKDERDALHKELDGLKTEQRTLIDGVKKRLQEAEEEKEKTSVALETAAGKVSELEQQKQALSDELEEKRMTVERYNEIVAGKDTVSSQAKEENERLKLELQDMERALQKAAVKIKNLEDENKTMQDEVSLAGEQRKKILFGYDDELATIKKQRLELLEQLKTAQDKLKAAQERVDRVDEREAALRKKYEKQITQLLEDNKDVQAKLEELRKEKSKYSKKQQEDVADAQDKIKAWQKKVADAEAKSKSLEQQLTLAQEQAALAQKQAEGLKTDMKDAEDRLKAAQDEVKALREKVRLSADEAAASQEKWKDTERRFDDYKKAQEESGSRREASLSEVTTALKTAQQHIEILARDKQDLLGKMDRINSQLLEYNDAITKNISLNKENKQLKTGLDDTVKKLNEAETKYQDLQAQHQKEKAAWEGLRQEYESSLDLVDQAKELKAKNQSLFETAKAYELKLKKLMESIVKLQEENDDLKSTTQSKVSPKAYKDVMAKNEALEQENAGLKLEVNNLRGRVRNLHSENEDISKERMLQDRKIEKMDAHLEDWDKEKKDWEKDQTESRALIANKESKISDMREALRKTLDENSRLQGRLDEYPRSLASLNANIEKLEKENAYLHYNMGVIYSQKGLYEDAVKEFKKALEMKPDDSFSHYNLGIIYSQYLIDEEEAVRHFKDYLKNAPNDKDADLARRYVYTRENYESQKKN